MVTGVLPCDAEAGHLLFAWDVLRDIHPTASAAVLGPCVAGTALLCATFLCQNTKSLAEIALAATFTPTALVFLGSAWSDASCTAVLAERSLPAALVVGLVVASLHMPQGPGTVRVRHVQLGAATLVAIAHFGWPWQGGILAVEWGHVVISVLRASSPGNMVAAGVLSIVLGLPITALVRGYSALFRRNRHDGPIASTISVLGLPLLLSPLAAEALSGRGSRAASILPNVGPLIALAVSLTLTAHAATLLSVPETTRTRPSLPPRLFLAILIPLAVALIPLFASPSARRAYIWRAGPPVAVGEALFGDRLPRWNDGQTAEAPAPIDLHETTGLARSIDRRLGDAVEELLASGNARRLTQRRWNRLIDRVNEASQAAALPYYVDPTEMVVDARGENRPWLRLDTYRIERVRRFSCGSRLCGALHVHRLTPQRSARPLLGLSRDAQTFAVIVLDEIDAYAGELESLVHRPQPRCANLPKAPPWLAAALARCGDLLAREVEGGDLRQKLLATVERHELEHQMDGPDLRPAALLQHLPRFLQTDDTVRRNRELSAYLAQFTAPGDTAHLSLVRLLRMALLDPARSDGGAARMTFAALLNHDVGASSEGVVQAFEVLAGLDEATLLRQAKAAWEVQFGAPLGRVQPVDDQ